VDLIGLLFALLVVPPILYLRYRLMRSRPSDDEAIESLMRARRLRAVAVRRDTNYWRYWSRGHLFSLRNVARIYVVLGEDPGGTQHELAIAFDNWPPSRGDLQILGERTIEPPNASS
jgi:hypothetical protein